MRKRSESQKVFGRGTIPLFLFSGICIAIFSCRKDPCCPKIDRHQHSNIEKNSSVCDREHPEFKATDQASAIDPNTRFLSETPLWHHPRSTERLDERKRMVDVIEHWYGLENSRVLEAMLNVPRHWFVPEENRANAYIDGPLLIGHGQTISQPFMVAYMTSLLELTENMRVLEIGTGSGYQAAVLTEFTPYIYTIEILEPLGKTAQKTLRTSGYKTIKVKIGDGYKGWPEYAPFDVIIVTCAPDHIPQDLLEQLKPDGKMIIPVGGVYQIQDLILVTKDKEGKIAKESKMPVRFVPMIHKENR